MRKSKKNTKKKKLSYKKVYPIMLLVATLFLGIGYAAVTDINLLVSGNAIAQANDGIFVSAITYLSDVDADDANSTMEVDYQTLLNNTIVLSDNNKDSSISYQITIYNNTNDDYAFYDTLYGDDELFYDNQDIVFTTSGINKWDEIKSKDSITFTITFQYKDEIKNGIENITENELNSIINFKFSKYYNITYENIPNNNYPTRVFEGENLNVTFVNDIPDYVEINGARLFDYEKPNLIIANVENDITITGNILFKQDIAQFNGTSDYINTNVALFSAENINKNFEISFEIAEYGNNEDMATLINSMYEDGNGWPGFLIRLQNNDGTLKLYYDSNSENQQIRYNQFYDYAGIKKVEIVRIDNVVYYRFNDGEYIETIDYSTLDMTFDTPVTFGASLYGGVNPFRYFQGTLTNMRIKFLEDDYELEGIYKYKGEKTFNGTTDYVDTGIYLFNQENRDKNFEISVEIIQNAYLDASTLVNILDESGDPYYGIVLRCWGDQFQLTANVNTGNTYAYYFPYDNVQKIRIVKIDNILYLIVNNDAPVYINDFSGFDGNLDDVPVTFGAALDGNRQPFRFFGGTLSNMSVRFLDNVITTIDDYVELYN